MVAQQIFSALSSLLYYSCLLGSAVIGLTLLLLLIVSASTNKPPLTGNEKIVSFISSQLKEASSLIDLAGKQKASSKKVSQQLLAQIEISYHRLQLARLAIPSLGVQSGLVLLKAIEEQQVRLSQILYLSN